MEQRSPRMVAKSPKRKGKALKNILPVNLQEEAEVKILLAKLDSNDEPEPQEVVENILPANLDNNDEPESQDVANNDEPEPQEDVENIRPAKKCKQ